MRAYGSRAAPPGYARAPAGIGCRGAPPRHGGVRSVLLRASEWRRTRRASRRLLYALAGWAIRRSFVSLGRVVEVRLDRCRRATEPVGDLPDREALELAVMPRQGHRPSTLKNPTHSRGWRLARHTASRYVAQLAFLWRSARTCRRTG